MGKKQNDWQLVNEVLVLFGNRKFSLHKRAELMKTGRSSKTAEWVAACRGIEYLPPADQIFYDPLSAQVPSGALRLFSRFADSHPNYFLKLFRHSQISLSMIWIKLRSKIIDKFAHQFFKDGGQQLLVLGAGFDFLSLRIAEDISQAAIFEVDHPKTQKVKIDYLRRQVNYTSNVHFVPFDFEKQSMTLLYRKLSESGFDSSSSTFVVCEGVTMYLSELAIARIFTMLSRTLGAGSILIMEYYERESLNRGNAFLKILNKIGILKSEQFTFGWQPQELAAWLSSRGFLLIEDMDDTEITSSGLMTTTLQDFRAAQGHWKLHLALIKMLTNSRALPDTVPRKHVLADFTQSDGL